MKILKGAPASLVVSNRFFCEDLLAKSIALRHQESQYIEEVVPTLRTYDEQVGAAKTLLYCSHRRSRHTLLAVDAALFLCGFASPPFGELTPAAAEELAYLRRLCGPGCPRVEEDSFTLKDLGWNLRWRDPRPDCVVFRNSIAEVEALDEPLSIFGLLEYGVVPSDLDDCNQQLMRDAGLITDESDALLEEHDGDWRAMHRDDSLAGNHLC